MPTDFTIPLTLFGPTRAQPSQNDVIAASDASAQPPSATVGLSRA
jgi:hypothetical protein